MGGGRKYIMVQLPEPCKEYSEAYKAGYKNICEIGKERIRRAGDKIIKELSSAKNDLLTKNKSALDIGFKVFKLDTSNIKVDTNDLLADDFVIAGRSSLDVFYELVLKYGYFDYQQTTLTIDNTKCYALLNNNGNPFLIAILDDKIKSNKFAIELMKLTLSLIIFRDICFTNDAVKLNTIETLKQLKSKDNNLQWRII
jgi:adenine-specific DNA-methyltransferase